MAPFSAFGVCPFSHLCPTPPSCGPHFGHFGGGGKMAGTYTSPPDRIPANPVKETFGPLEGWNREQGEDKWKQMARRNI